MLRAGQDEGFLCSRIRENSEVFSVGTPNSHESGYSLFTLREASVDSRTGTQYQAPSGLAAPDLPRLLPARS